MSATTLTHLFSLSLSLYHSLLLYYYIFPFHFTLCLLLFGFRQDTELWARFLESIMPTYKHLKSSKNWGPTQTGLGRGRESSEYSVLTLIIIEHMLSIVSQC